MYSCPEGWELHQGHCYIVPVSESLKNLDDANQDCDRMGGVLASVDTAALKDIVQDLLKRTAPDNVESVWIANGYLRCSSLEKASDWEREESDCEDRKGWVCLKKPY